MNTEMNTNTKKRLFDYFDHIYIINLPRNKSRLERLKAQLDGLYTPQKLTVIEAIDGSQLPAPAYWKQGNGAWGCLMSHIRTLQEAWQKNFSKVLILEDDAIFDSNAAAWLADFFECIPDDWGQIYLGGMHQKEPVWKKNYYEAKSVNRTHAYAVQRAVIPRLLQHVSHAPDYMNNTYRHIDHQLELAHQRGDWKAYAPRWWVFGQGENKSDINGCSHPDKWWDWCNAEKIFDYPWIIVTPQTRETELSELRHRIHFGWTLESDGKTDKGMRIGMKRMNRGGLVESVKAISLEAFQMRRIPAVFCAEKQQVEIFMQEIKPKTIELADALNFDTIQWGGQI